MIYVVQLYIIFLLYYDDQQERLEKKDKGEVERDDVPQLTQKDLEMAEKVSKYNVSCVFHHSFLKCVSATQVVICVKTHC